jgi:large subunit ribosomal protein L25
MSEDILTVSQRAETGKQGAKRVRKNGLVPGVVYGGDSPPLPVQVESLALEASLRHGSLTKVISLSVEGGEDCQALMRAPVRHPVSMDLLHVDLLRVTARSRVTVQVPIELTGISKGVLEGGVLDQVIHELSLDCLAGAIPENIVVDISELGINENIHVETLELAPDVNVHADPRAAVVTVSPPRVIEEEEVGEEEIETDEMAEPEVIGAKPDDDEDQDEDDSGKS